MNVLSVFLLLLLSTFSYGQSIAQPDSKLVNAAVERYLQEMKQSFNITPSTFIVEVADKNQFAGIQTKIGGATIILKTKKELQALSAQKAGKAIGFFAIEVEKTSDGNYLVDIMDDGIKCTMQDGNATFSYDSIAAGRACELIFDASFKFKSIDCLLLPTDPGQ